MFGNARLALLAFTLFGISPAGSAAQPPLTDRYGDPLPSGALARLGTLRWRLDGPVWSLAFSPDGKTLVTGGAQTVFWDVATGKSLHRLPARTSSVEVRSYRRFPNGPVAITCDGQSTVLFWDLASGKTVRRLRLPKELAARGVRLTPDGKTLAVRQIESNLAFLVDVATGKMLHPIEVKGGVIQDLTFSPDGKTLAVGTLNPSVQLWDVTTGKFVRGIDHHEDEFVSSLAFSPDGKSIAAGFRGLIVLADVRTGAVMGSLAAKMRWVNNLAFTSDGKTLVSSTEDGVRVWDVAGRKERFTLNIRYGRVFSLALSPDGKRVAAGTSTHTVYLWDVETGKVVPTELGENILSVNCVAFTPDGKRLLSGTDLRIRVWDTATWKSVGSWEGSARSLSYSHDGKQVAAVPAYEPAVRVWAADTGRCVRQLPRPGVAYVWRAVFSGDGKAIVSVDSKREPGSKGVAHLVTWDAATGRLASEVPLPEVIPESLALAPDGRTAFVGDTAGVIHVCDLESRRGPIALLGHRHYVETLALSPDGRKLLSGSFDRSVRLWEVATCKEVFALQGHQRAVAATAFSPHGRLLATAGGSPAHPYEVAQPTTIRLWDVASGKQVGHFRGHDSDVTSLAFSPDGGQLAAALSNTTVLVWEIPAHLRRRPQALRLGAEDLARLWGDLAVEDATKAHRAVWSMAASPNESVAFLNSRVRPVPAPDETQLRRWIADLNSERFAAREAASRNLEGQGEFAKSALEKMATAKSSSQDARQRAKQLLKKLAGPLTSPDRVRSLRAVEVLEYAGTKEARQLLNDLAGGAPGARLTEDARAALTRLEKRTSTP